MPGNPLDLFVDNRVLSIKYNPSDINDAYYFDLPVGDYFTIREVDIIHAIIRNPMGHTTTEYNQDILSAAAYRYADRFAEDYYVVAQRFLNWLWDEHKIMWVDGNHNDDNPMFIKYCHNYDINNRDWDDIYVKHHEYPKIAIYKDECLWGVIDRSGNKAWFHEDGDYVYDEYADIYYINDNIADYHGVTWRDCCERYMSCGARDCCDVAREEGEDMHFDETYTDMYKPKDLSFVNLTKTSGMDYTFGVELETCYSRDVGYQGNYNLKAVYDGSTDGLEYVTGVLQGNKGIKQLESICSMLSDYGAKVDRKCGVHVHIGGAEFNRRFSIIMLKLCLDIESDIYKLLPESRQGNTYCKKLPKDLIERMNFHNYKETLGTIIQNCIISREYNKKKGHPGGHYNSQRYYWVNITNYSTATGSNTIEFRPHSGSLDYKKIYNWLLICMSIVKFAENRQRRVWTSGMSKHPITLQEVLKYSLNQKLFNQVYEYCVNRAQRFGNTL